MKRDFIHITDFSAEEIQTIFNISSRLKKETKEGSHHHYLKGKTLAMIFEKPSTRTRISFDLAIKQLGGSSMILNPDGIHYGKGNETLKDTAKVLSEYADIIMLRTSSHENLKEFGKHLNIPIINEIITASLDKLSLIIECK